MINSKLEKIFIFLFSLFLFFISGNIYALIRLNELKKNSYRSNDKYTNVDKKIYAKNINSREVNLYGDLCAVEGSYDECSFSSGERSHQFSTDRYGFKTTAELNDSNLIIIGDSFLAASGGDNMNEQFGSVIGNLISKEVYEAAHPGDINDYNQRHYFLKKINPDAKFIYLLYEGNDFHASELPKTKSKKGLRKKGLKQYVVYVKNQLFSTPLFKLIISKYAERTAKEKLGTNDSKIIIQKLKSGRIQAFLKSQTNKADLKIRSSEYSYIFKNADSICGIVYVPTAYTTYLSKASLEQTHPNLYEQFIKLQKDGIDIVDLTLSFQEAAKRETKDNPIWWSDDTHWNARGIRLGAETSLKSLSCLN